MRKIVHRLVWIMRLKSTWKWPINSDFVCTPFRDFAFDYPIEKFPTQDIMSWAIKFDYVLAMFLRGIFNITQFF